VPKSIKRKTFSRVGWDTVITNKFILLALIRKDVAFLLRFSLLLLPRRFAVLYTQHTAFFQASPTVGAAGVLQHALVAPHPQVVRPDEEEVGEEGDHHEHGDDGVTLAEEQVEGPRQHVHEAAHGGGLVGV